MNSLTYEVSPKGLDLRLMAVKRNIYASVLVVLFALKITSAAFHIYFQHGSDDQHIEDCELCEHAISIQNVESSTPQEFHITTVDHSPILGQPESFYVNVCFTAPYGSIHFSRPPPSII